MEDEKSLIEAAAFLKVLADPNRLRVFSVLMQGDSCNCELKDKLGLPSNLLSHHLGVLREVGLVDSRRDVVDGRWVYYTVNRETVGQWHSWLVAFLDPARVETRQMLCGPEGQLLEKSELVTIE